MIHTFFRQEGVSPVVGVMLMLAVTVMIAAVVSTYAGGFSDTPDNIPQAGFKARVSLLENRTYFDHAGGDPVLLNAIQVVFIRSEKKTTLSRADIGKTCINFTQVGTSENIVRAGGTFYIEGETPDNSLASHTGIRFGNLNLQNDTEVTWMIVDSRRSRTIAAGILYL